MFLRTIKTRGREYYQVVESYRENGVVKKRVINHLGPIEKLASMKNKSINPDDIYMKDTLNVEYGASFTLNEICNELNVEEHINKFIKKQAEITTIGKAMKLASIHKCIRQNGYNDISNWLETSILKFTEKIESTSLRKQNFNNWLDNFDEKTVDDIQTSLSKYVIERIKPDLSRIIIDFTNVDTYQQIRHEEDQIAKRGKSKSNKKSLLQINYALVCSNDGIPLHHTIYEGNINDSDYFKTFSTQVMDKYDSFFNQEDNLVFIFDKGMNSEDSILNISRKYKFVGALRPSECKHVCVDITKYKTIGKDKNGYEVKCFEFDVLKYKKKFEGIASYHEKTAKLIEHQYEDKISKVKKELTIIKQKLNQTKWTDKETVEKRITALLKKYDVKNIFDVELVSEDSLLKFKRCDIDEEAFKELKKSWGIGFIFTNIEKMEPDKLIDIYFREKNTIENCNKLLKDEDFCNAEPIRTWIDEHTRAHFLRCTIGLTIGTILANRINSKMQEKWEPATIIDHLKNLNVVSTTLMPFNKKKVALSNYDTQHKPLFNSLKLVDSFKKIKGKLITYKS